MAGERVNENIYLATTFGYGGQKRFSKPPLAIAERYRAYYQKTMKRYLIYISISLISIWSCGQSNPLIYGQWEETKVTWRNGETGKNVTIDKKDYEPHWNLKFLENGTCYDLDADFEHNYKLTKKYLTIGNSTYILKTLTKDKLILIEYDEDDPKDPSAFVHEFKKVTN